MAKIVICAPPHTERSDGARALYFLCRSLREIGIDANMLLMDLRDKTYRSFAFIAGAAPESDPTAPRFLGTDDHVDLANDIIIYPEIVPDNPLGARHVARYFLNKEGNLTGLPIAIAPTDMLLAYQRIFRPDASFCLYYPMINLAPGDEIEYALNRPRSLSTTFFGKGIKYGTCTRVPGTVGLDWDKSYEEYQLLLRSSNYVFTYDFMSGVCADAVIHGAIPVVMNTAPWTAEEMEMVELKFPYITYEQYQARASDSALLVDFLARRRQMFDDTRAMRADWPQRMGRLVAHFENTFDVRCARLQTGFTSHSNNGRQDG
jgi:hypothetical protein